MDPNEERFITYKEKSLKLYQQFKKPVIQKKVQKEVEAFAESIRIPKEVVRIAREENIISEEQSMKKEEKPKVPKPKARQVRSTTPSFGPAKLEINPKSSIKTSGGEKKRKTNVCFWFKKYILIQIDLV